MIEPNDKIQSEKIKFVNVEDNSALSELIVCHRYSKLIAADLATDVVRTLICSHTKRRTDFFFIKL